MIAADAPKPLHAIGTAVIAYAYRGGHATKPKALAHLKITVGGCR